MVAGQLVSCTAHRRHGVTTNGLAECVDSYRKKEGVVGATGCKPCDAGCCVGRKLVPRHWAAVFSTGRHCRVRWTTFECVHRSINVEFAETSAQERKSTPTIARDKKGGSLVGFSRGEASRQCSVKRLHACISTYFHGLRLDLLLCFRHFLLKQRYTRSLVLHLL